MDVIHIKEIWLLFVNTILSTGIGSHGTAKPFSHKNQLYVQQTICTQPICEQIKQTVTTKPKELYLSPYQTFYAGHPPSGVHFISLK